MLLFGSASASSSSNSIFLLPNGTFVFELVIFIVVLGLVAKFVLPPMQQVMDERERKILEGLGASDSGRMEALRLEAERRQTLDGARAAARQLLEEAAQRASALVDESRARGQVEYARLVGEGDARLSAERSRLREDAFSNAAALVVRAAAQVIGEEIDPTRHAGEIDRAIAERVGRS